MTNTSPFFFLNSFADRFQPPSWLVEQGQQRLVLFFNHVLLQEKQAQDRLLRQKGRIVHIKWGLFAIDLIVTPAGLLDRAPALAKPDLVLSLAGESPFALVQAMLAGKPPPVKIEGDVQLAAEIGWLAENLRWDAEEDLSRLIGDVPAHALADAGRRLASSLKQFLAKGPLSPSPVQTVPPSAAVSTAPATTPERRATPMASGLPAFDTSPELSSPDLASFDKSEMPGITDAGMPPPPKASA